MAWPSGILMLIVWGTVLGGTLESADQSQYGERRLFAAAKYSVRYL